MYAWVFEYFVSPIGFEIRLFRSLLIYPLKRENIVNAHVIDGWFGGWKYGSRPWNTIVIANRFRRQWVLLEKRRWPRFLSITPDDATGFVQTLALTFAGSKRQR